MKIHDTESGFIIVGEYDEIKSICKSLRRAEKKSDYAWKYGKPSAHRTEIYSLFCDPPKFAVGKVYGIEFEAWCWHVVSGDAILYALDLC